MQSTRRADGPSVHDLGENQIPSDGNIGKSTETGKVLTQLIKDWGPAYARAANTNAAIDNVVNALGDLYLVEAGENDEAGQWVRVPMKKVRYIIRTRLNAWKQKHRQQEQEPEQEQDELPELQEQGDGVPPPIAERTPPIAERTSPSATTTAVTTSDDATTTAVITGDDSPFLSTTIDFTDQNLPVAEPAMQWLSQAIINIDVKLLEELANSSDPSVVYINGAIELFLDPEDDTHGNAKGYKQLFGQPRNSLYLAPKRLLELLDYIVRNEKEGLAGFEVRSPALLLGFGTRGPQPIHADIGSGNNSLFGILTCTPGSPGTNYCKMGQAPASPSINDLHNCLMGKNYSPGAVDSLCNKISNNDKAMTLVSEYGQLLFASKDCLVTQGTVDQFSLTALRGSHPHGAPACNEPRGVIFFTIEPSSSSLDSERGDANYNGSTQISRVKFPFLLYEELREEYDENGQYNKDFSLAEREILIFEFMEFYAESASMGAYDNTFEDLPTDWEDQLKEIGRLATEASTRDKLIDDLKKQLAEEERMQVKEHEELAEAIRLATSQLSSYDYKDYLSDQGS